ncbi:MAG: ABC transporter ATP-binding protein [Rectinemataceae bacterium]|jgi:NitT/TauT family transport system ATP-binding protein
MAFELRSLRASYDGLPVVDGISLNLAPESITVLLGPSGCGKSTLLNLIAGLKEPDSGERIGFDDCRFSYAFQEARLLPWLDCRENAAFALRGAFEPGFGRSEARARIDRFLAAAGIAEAAELRPSELSGGMRQRLSLVRAFAYPSDILLLDEAFQAVDLRMKLELMNVFLSLWQEEKRTVVCVTHDVEEAAYLADRAVVLSPRPARIVDSFAVEVPRRERALGASAMMEAESRLYKLALLAN